MTENFKHIDYSLCKVPRYSYVWIVISIERDVATAIVNT